MLFQAVISIVTLRACILSSLVSVEMCSHLVLGRVDGASPASPPRARAGSPLATVHWQSTPTRVTSATQPWPGGPPGPFIAFK